MERLPIRAISIEQKSLLTESVILTPLHSAYSESARRAAPGVRRRSAQGASGSVLRRRRSEWLSSRSVDVAVAMWHQSARYSTTSHFAQLFPPFDSISWLLPVQQMYICVTGPNFVQIGQTISYISQFNGSQDGGHPPSWIYRNSKWRPSAILGLYGGRIWTTHDEHLIVFGFLQNLVGIDAVV